MLLTPCQLVLWRSSLTMQCIYKAAVLVLLRSVPACILLRYWYAAKLNNCFNCASVPFYILLHQVILLPRQCMFQQWCYIVIVQYCCDLRHIHTAYYSMQYFHILCFIYLCTAHLQYYIYLQAHAASPWCYIITLLHRYIPS